MVTPLFWAKSAHSWQASIAHFIAWNFLEPSGKFPLIKPIITEELNSEARSMCSFILSTAAFLTALSGFIKVITSLAAACTQCS